MKCPKCDSEQLHKNGSRHGRQQYRCKDCGRQFIKSLAPRGYSHDVRQICIRMYRRGLTLRQIEKLTGISHSTIHNWVKQADEEGEGELCIVLPLLASKRTTEI